MKQLPSTHSPEGHPPEALLALLAARFAPWWVHYAAVEPGEAITAIRRTFRPNAPSWLEAVEDSAIWAWTARIDGHSWEPLVQPLNDFVVKHGADWDRVSLRCTKNRVLNGDDLIRFFDSGCRS